MIGALYVMYADGGNLTKVVPKGISAPSWSPDGSQIAYGDGSTIAVMDANGANRQVLLTPDDLKPHGNLYYPAWSPDGARIAVGGEYAKMGIGVPFGGLFIVDTQTRSSVNPECTRGYWITSLSWSPDGQKNIVL